MLHDPKVASRQGEAYSPDEVLQFDLRYVLGVLNRQRRLIGLVTAAIVALVVAFCLLAPMMGLAYYTGTAQVILDQQRAQVFRADNSLTGDITFDNASVESQVATIQSERVLTSVVRKLNLIDDPEFNGSGSITIGSLIKKVTGPIMAMLVGEKPPATEEQRVRGVADLIGNKRLKVQRVGLSYAIDINVDSWSADRAALIANEIANTYIEDQVTLKEQVIRRAGDLLIKQLEELRLQASDADRKVLDFKVANNLIDVAGTLLSDQQLAEVSSQLSAARSATAESKARLDRIKAVSASEIPDASVTDALRNEVITRLRNQYLDNAQKEAEWSGRYGPNHVQVTQLRAQMAENRKSVIEEMGRIGQGYNSDYEISLARQKALEEQLRNLFQQTAGSRNLQVTLRDLEARAQSYRTLHDSLLSKLNMAAQQQSFATPDARVISRATPPQDRSSPKNGLLVAASLVLGLGLGCGLAFMREYFDHAIRSTAQLEQVTNADFVGVLPFVVPPPRNAKAGSSVASKIQIPDYAQGRVLKSADPLLSYVTDMPFSRYTETMRGLRVASRISATRRAQKVIGIVSTLEAEGKSTIAANLARLIASVGDKVLLIDGDLRNSSLTRRLAPTAELGLAQVLAGARIDEALWYDPISPMQFVPASVGTERLTNTSELVASEAMSSLLEAAREVFDIVIVDLPPLDLTVDARAASHLIDAFVFVAEWGRTPLASVEKVLAAHPEVARKVVGAILNKADLAQLDQYEGRSASRREPSGYYVG